MRLTLDTITLGVPQVTAARDFYAELLAPAGGNGDTVELPAREVEVVDTVGAGDSFMAGLLSGLLDSGLLGSDDARERLRRAVVQDLESALHRAVSTASWTVGRAGAAAPTRDDLG